MKRFFRVLMVCFILLASIGIIPGLAEPNDPPPLFLPFMTRYGGSQAVTHTVSGAVRDSGQYPLASVLIEASNGASATTGLDGTYSIQVPEGPTTLTATRSGYNIEPLSLNVTANLTQVNFSAQVGCGNIVVNEQVTVGMGGWNFLTDQEDDVVPGTDTTVFQSAPSSGRVGIDPADPVNIASTTRARSQLYHIPDEADADAVFLGLYVYQLDTGAGEFDRQYIDLVDEGGNIHNLYTASANTAAWTYLEFPLDDYLGETVRIQIRVLNDGGAFYSTMYFDDVTLVICNTHCDSQVVNGGFEARDGWLYNAEAIINPWYTGVYFHTGLWSMQTGIPPAGVTNIGGTYYFNVESSSEVWQRNIDLPGDQSGALLTFWIYRTSVEGVPPPGAPAVGFDPTRYAPALADTASRGPLVVNATPPEDWVYVYVYDDDGGFLAKPLWQRATNDNTWMRYSFDLSDYMGQQIELLFGTYNDGLGGPSAMWIDDVVVGTCD